MVDAGLDKFFRSMTPNSDGFPKVARSARTLGVRVPDDVEPDDEGKVLPATGGMSVAPTSMWNLPNHRRPRGLERGSTGPDADWVFSMQRRPLESLSLTARPDADNPVRHAFIEPVVPMALGEYERALAGTRPSWSKAWP